MREASKPTKKPIERAGWYTEHPVTGRAVEVVTAAWFREVKGQLDEAYAALDQAVHRYSEQRAELNALKRDRSKSGV